jgi:4-amino-4-deoxy-L-arabinose transferase-like glycosyltransferase
LFPRMTDPRRFTRPTFVLIFAAVVVYLVGNAQVPLWDRDEPRYAQCSRQMLQSGDWVVPRLYDDLRTAKPPVIYWCQATAMAAFGENEFAARLPSAVAMGLTLLMVAAAVRRSAGPEHAFWTVLVLGSGVLTIVAAKSCLTDAVLLAFITAGQFCVYRIWRGGATWPVVVLLGLVDGLGVMTKGPVVPGIHATTLAALWFLRWSLTWDRPRRNLVLLGLVLIGVESLIGDYAFLLFRGRTPLPMTWVLGMQALTVGVLVLVGRRRTVGSGDDARSAAGPQIPRTPDGAAGREGQARWVAGVGKVLAWAAIVVAVGLPWAILLEQRSPGFLRTMLFHEVGERATTAQEGHQGPFGYYIVSIWPTFLPWSLILPATLVLAWRRRGDDPRVRFALAAVLGPWLMFEEVRTKLPHYLLPCFVPLAYLAADGIVQCLRHGSVALSDRGFVRGTLVWSAVVVLLGFAPFAAAWWFMPQPWGVLAGVAVLATGYAVVVARYAVLRKTQEALAAMGLGGLLLFAVIFRVYLPNCEYLKLSVRAAEVLRANGATARGQAVMLDYKEPSLAFYQGGTIRERSNTILTPEMLTVTPPAQREAREAALKATGHKWVELPDWAVVTREVWDRSAPRRPGDADARGLLDVVATFRGLDIADGMRNVEVMVIRRKSAAGGGGKTGG